jgi:putative redox protein
MNSIEVSFPGGKRVDAKIGEMLIHTDQSREHGGEGSAPDPFNLFLASIATCAGFYAMAFCQSRGIAADGMTLSLGCEWNEKNRACERLRIRLNLPEGFPERYRDAVLKAMDQCLVKKHILHPPEFVITTS